MTGGGQLWKTAIADAMGAARRFPTAAHRPWKTPPRFPHSHRAGGSSFFFLKPYERTPCSDPSFMPSFRLILR